MSKLQYKKGQPYGRPFYLNFVAYGTTPYCLQYKILLSNRPLIINLFVQIINYPQQFFQYKHHFNQPTGPNKLLNLNLLQIVLIYPQIQNQ